MRFFIAMKKPGISMLIRELKMSALSKTKAPRGGLILALLLGFAAMAALQTFSPHLPGNDGYYHLKMALLLPERGYVQDLPWLRWTIFHDGFVSHHHGFHTLLAPFATLSQSLTGDAVLGGKLAAAIAMAATFGLLHVTLRYIGARPTPIWLLLLCAGPWHFWLRMSYVRAPLVALPLLVLAVHWCLRGRTLAIGLLAFVFTQIYGGAVLFPLIPFAFLAAQILTYLPLCQGGNEGGRSKPTRTIPTPVRRAVWQCVAACLGVALGMVLNPYFPANLLFMYTQVFETGLGAPEGVGSEWKTFDGWNLLLQSVPLGIVWLWCLTRRLQTAVGANSGEIALLLLNVLFLVLTLKARRFVEYWPVFAMLNAASFYAVTRWAICKGKPRADQPRGVAEDPDHLRATGHQSTTGHHDGSSTSCGAPVPSPLAKGGPREVGSSGEAHVDSQAMASTAVSTTAQRELMPPSAGSRDMWPGRLALAALAVVAAINLSFTRFELNVSHDVPAIREAMNFMRENSEPASLILTDDWDSFPTCFYFNHHNNYAVGLDPEFTRTRYPALWERYRRITRAELPARVPAEWLQLEMEADLAKEPVSSEPACTDPKIRYEDIATCFHADYVLVADDHRKLYKALLGEPDHFTPVYPPDATADSPQAPITIFAVHLAN